MAGECVAGIRCFCFATTVTSTVYTAEISWEDYDYTRFNRNRLAWWGDGWTERERNGLDLVSHYLENVDYPPVNLPN